MKKRIALIACVCIIVVAATVTAAFYLPDYFTPKVATPDAESIVWATNVTYTVGDLAYADGRVFVTARDDEYAYCYDAADGTFLWQIHLGHRQGYPLITVLGDYVYFTSGQAVLKLNQSTGDLECQYQISSADNQYLFNKAGSFKIEDQKMIVNYENSGVVVYDLESGQPLWSNNPNLGFHVYSDNVTAPEISRLFFRYDPNNLNVDANEVVNGSTYWTYIRSGGISFRTEDKIILNNYNSKQETNSTHSEGYPEEYDTICIDRETGQRLWTFKPQYLTFNQVIYGDTLLFASYDGCFYALNIDDGTVRWKTQVTDLSLNPPFSVDDVPTTCVVTPPYIDQKNDRLYWAFTNHTINVNEVFAVYSLDLLNGEPKLTTQNEGSFNVALGGTQEKALVNNHFFVQEGTDIICLEVSSGNDLWIRSGAPQFMGFLLADDKAITVVGNQLVAYR